VAAGSLTGQALTGLADELFVSLLPVVFGSAARFFGDYATPPVRLDNPEAGQEDRAAHLHCRVRKPSHRPCDQLADQAPICIARLRLAWGIAPAPIGGPAHVIPGPRCWA
jgi:hypothetical protein